MSLNINDVYNFMVYIIRKQRGGLLSVQECTSALDAGQMIAVDEWFSAYGTTQKIHDALKQIRVYQPFTSDVNGNVNYQTDYLHLLGNPFTVFGSSITKATMINEDEFPAAMTSKLRALSNDYPIIVNTATGFTIYPQQIQTGAYWYLKRPATPVLAYTQVGRVITYDAANSVQLEFTDNYINNIIAKALSFIGINLDEGQVYAFAQQYNSETK